MKQKKVLKKNTTLKEQPITKKAESTKYVYWDEYMDLNSFKMRPVSEEFIKRLAKDLREWVRANPKIYKICGFYIERGIPQATYNRWVKQHEILGLAHKEALMILGERRETMALENKLNGAIVSFTMPHYDEEWKSNVEWRAKLKQDEAKNETVKVIIEEIKAFNKLDEVEDV